MLYSRFADTSVFPTVHEERLAGRCDIELLNHCLQPFHGVFETLGALAGLGDAVGGF
jgi:hypothetical protein